MLTCPRSWYAWEVRARAIVLLALAGACSRTDFFDFPSGKALPPRCGDGDAQATEACDDGNTIDTDGCRADCTRAICGDGVVFAGAETCDDGNAVSGDGCEPDCALPRCGDQIVEGPTETCDDGNDDDQDECLSSCLFAFCGDGQVFRGVEACDDANTIRTDGCIDCQLARCGDGEVRRHIEACDDGNRDDLDGCSNRCTEPVCGDGVVAQGEGCDFGPDNEDTPALVIRQGSLVRAVQPRLGARSIEDEYDYRSASSHLGVEQAREGRVFLYLDRTELRTSLVLNYGSDGDQPGSKVHVKISGWHSQARVLIADDRSEELHAGDLRGEFVGDFGFDDNTDGGAIGDLNFPGDFVITVEHTQLEGIDTLVFLDGDTRIPLDGRLPFTIESRFTGARCNTRCNVPRCGDGRLDPGERCDSPDPLCGPSC